MPFSIRRLQSADARFQISADAPRRIAAPIRLSAIVFFGVAGVLVWFAAEQVEGANDVPDADRKIAELIESLGSDQFATRERAQDQLRRMGAAAFDALHEAREHPDIEVAMRVRQLLLGMRVVWSQETDAAEVRSLLNEFGLQSDVERRSRIDSLALIDGESPIASLCRIARFDALDELSKRAAIQVMNHAAPTEAAARREYADKVQQLMTGSRRPAAEWLRMYSRSLGDPESTIDAWGDIVQREIDSIDVSGDPSLREAARDLLRWFAELLDEHNRHEQANEIAGKSLTLMEGTREQLLDAVDWLIERKAYGHVSELADRFPEAFREQALLRYRLAEALLKQGNSELAEKTAQEALDLRPEETHEHVEVAETLQMFGLYDWAEREFRFVLEKHPDGMSLNLKARLSLSEMLHDLQREEDAAKTLQALVEPPSQEGDLRNRIAEMMAQYGRSIESVRARMHFFFSQHAVSQNDLKGAREHLERAIASEPADADVLIAMHRLPDADDAWKAKTRTLVESAAATFRAQIQAIEGQLANRPDIGPYLAMLCNQYAWLVGNTEGDYADATALSHLSLQLKPNTAGYLDTLGRCYFSQKDYENAVKYQSRAARLEPHTQQIQRQLKIFEAALAKSRDTSGSPDSPASPRSAGENDQGAASP